VPESPHESLQTRRHQLPALGARIGTCEDATQIRERMSKHEDRGWTILSGEDEFGQLADEARDLDHRTLVRPPGTRQERQRDAETRRAARSG